MRRISRAAAAALVVAATALPVAVADARQFQMSGTWAIRRGVGFVPLQFADSKMGSQFTHTSAGLLSKARLTPNGPVLGGGAVSATGSAPATLVVPAHRFAGSFSTRLPLPPPTLIQITTQLDAVGPAAPATLVPGGGPGSFTWCPGDPACVDLPGTLDPAGPGGRGRVIYRAGANRFGGVMQMLLRGYSSISVPLQYSPFQALHLRRAPTSALDGGLQHTGGSYANVVLDYVPRGFATEPLAPPTPDGLIIAPGPRVTTMLGVTSAPGQPYPTLFAPTLTTSAMGLKAWEVHTHTGFPFTTGTVFAQQSIGSGGDDFFTVMGSDMRSALGAGNIGLVAGGLTRTRTNWGFEYRAGFGVVRITLAPPVPALSPAGAAAAALLVLLAVGRALRPRR